METLRHGTGKAGDGAELLAIAVDPAAAERGAGTLLVKGFLAEIEPAAAGRRLRRGRGGQRDGGRAVPSGRIRAMERFELHPGTESLLMQWPTRHPGGT